MASALASIFAGRPNKRNGNLDEKLDGHIFFWGGDFRQVSISFNIISLVFFRWYRCSFVLEMKQNWKWKTERPQPRAAFLVGKSCRVPPEVFGILGCYRRSVETMQKLQILFWYVLSLFEINTTSCFCRRTRIRGSVDVFVVAKLGNCHFGMDKLAWSWKGKFVQSPRPILSSKSQVPVFSNSAAMFTRSPPFSFARLPCSSPTLRTSPPLHLGKSSWKCTKGATFWGLVSNLWDWSMSCPTTFPECEVESIQPVSCVKLLNRYFNAMSKAGNTSNMADVGLVKSWSNIGSSLEGHLNWDHLQSRDILLDSRFGYWMEWRRIGEVDCKEERTL